MRPALPIVAAALVACGSDPALPPPAEEPERLWRDEIIYQIVTDRFANGDSSNDGGATLGCSTCIQGGDWQGIIDRLGYLEALGVTALWISPVVENAAIAGGTAAYHGYWPAAYDRPNPRFGDTDLLRALVDACHDRGLRVIVDVVLNHAGPTFYYDINGNDAVDPGEWTPTFSSSPIPGPIRFTDPTAVSPAAFLDPAWYHRRGQIFDFNDPTQSLTGDFSGGLRDLVTSDPDVRAALVDTTLGWLDAIPFDGIRYDAVKHVEQSFWDEVLPRVREHTGPGFLQVGEIFDGNLQNLVVHTEGERLDSVLNFAMMYTARDVFGAGAATNALEALHISAQGRFAATGHPGGLRSGPRDSLLNFLDNHDVPRFLAGAPSPALRPALIYLLTSDGIPVVYYGTEQDFSGGADPQNREPLWPSGFGTAGATFAHLRDLIAVRKDHEALRRGDTRFTYTTDHTATESDAGVVAFERFTATERILVVINSSPSARTTSYLGTAMSVSFAPGTVLRDVLDPGAGPYTVSNTATLDVDVPESSGRILIPRGCAGTVACRSSRPGRSWSGMPTRRFVPVAAHSG